MPLPKVRSSLDRGKLSLSTCTIHWRLPSIVLGIENESSGGDSSDDPLVLPDIKDMLKKKQFEQEQEQLEEEKRQSVKKIKRSDQAAFTKVSLMNRMNWGIQVLLPLVLIAPRSLLHSYWSRNRMPMLTTPFSNKRSTEQSVLFSERMQSHSSAFHLVLCK